MINRLNIAFFFLFLICPSYRAKAADFHSPRTESLGGAGHAGPVLSDSIYLNPSFTSFTQTHSLGMTYLQYGGDTTGHLLNLSVLDGSSDSLFQAGVGYTRREDTSLIHIGASKNIIKQLSAGIGTKFIFPNDSSGNRFTDATFSVTGVLAPWIQSSLIIDNLFESATSMGFYREFTLGTKLNIMGIIILYIDPNWVPDQPTLQSKWGYQIGTELPVFGDFLLRLGTFTHSNIPHLNQRGDGYAVGAGWLAPRLAIDYSYSRTTVPMVLYAHNFSFTIFF